MTTEELEKATGQELIDERNYCGVDGYYGDYLDNVNAEMLKRFNRLAELEEEKQGLKDYCDKYTKTILSLRKNVAELEAQIDKMKCCGNCENGELSAHEEPCLHCQRCFASTDVTDQENVKDYWEAI